MEQKKANEEEEEKYDPLYHNPPIEVTNIQSEASVKGDEESNKKKGKSSREVKSKTLKADLNPLSMSTNSILSNNKMPNNLKGKGKDNQKDNERNTTKKKEEKHKIIDLEAHQLPDAMFINPNFSEEQLNEFEILRRNVLVEIAKKEEEERRRKEQEMRDNLNNAVVKNAKQFDSNKLTFDQNGKIIPLRIPRIETFGNEFYWSKQMVKHVAVFPTKIPTDKPSSSPGKKGGSKNDEPSLLKRMSTLVSSKNVNSVKEINVPQSENIEYNNSNNLFPEKYSKFSKLKNNPPILPAGPNIGIISPEVGVIITEGAQKKEGSMEFSAKFNKYSMGEFTRRAYDSMNLNSNKYLFSTLETPNKLEDSQQYIGYTEKFQSSNNPLIQNASVSRNLDNIKRDIPRERFMTSENPLFSHSKKHLYQSHQLETITTNEKLQTNLQIAIDSVPNNENPNKNLMSFEQNRFNTELFNIDEAMKEITLKGKLFPDKKEKIVHFDMMDDFNTKIIKSKDWGDSNFPMKKESYHRVPAKSNHLRELGFKIVSTKLPRERRLNSGNRITN